MMIKANKSKTAAYLSLFLWMLFIPVLTYAQSVSSWVLNHDGVTFTMDSGKLKIQVCSEDLVRITCANEASFPTKNSLVVIQSCSVPVFEVNESSDAVTLSTSRMKIAVTKANSTITYFTSNDKLILQDDGRNGKLLTEVDVEGVNTHSCQTTFLSPSDEGLFGLGHHQMNRMNYKGMKSLELEQANRYLKNAESGGYSAVPLLISSRGYGIFWDNYSKGWFNGNESSGTKYKMSFECGSMIDYYFMYGPEIDSIISSYRELTGRAPMFGKWAYGLFHSMDKYETQEEILAVKDGYRNNNIPLDVVVQDWRYWDPEPWGSHSMDPKRFPDPAGMLDSLHSANLHAMVTIWPYYASGSENHEELAKLGYLKPGNYYDAYNSDARKVVWRQIRDQLINAHGWDAIWVDSDEWDKYPESGNRRTSITDLGPGCVYYNAFPLMHTTGLYQGWRNNTSHKRAFLLSRSTFAGQQRNAAASWSGDTYSQIDNYERQIPGGLNLCLTGIPYINNDIGGYHGITDWSGKQNNELFTRWFQYGAFCPIFRVHGKGHRELFGDQFTNETKAILLKFDKLRYRLMPYIYSLAWKVTSENYTIQRHLIFDYRTDTKVYNIKDQFMFGPAIMVNPVISYGASSRTVYLPSGVWYDFWTGKSLVGGQSINASAPIEKIPLYVKAGSIVPMGPNIQYATQSIDTLEIRVYRGADASFTLYEDEGDNYNYENGDYSTIPFAWNESSHTLTIGSRSGSYIGMPKKRVFNVVWVSSDQDKDIDLTPANRVIRYKGSQVIINCSDPTSLPSSSNNIR